MRLEVRRSNRGTLSVILNLALTGTAGVVILGNQWVAAVPSNAGIVVGVLLLAWAGVILSGLLRPVTMVVDDEGVTLRRMFGEHRFGWDDLVWADLRTSDRFAVITARIGGKDRFAGFAKRAVRLDDLAEAEAAIAARRPDLPLSGPRKPGPEEEGA